jgi:hypothetical protein
MLGIVYYWVYHITMHRNATFWEKSHMTFLRQGCHWWRLGLVPGHAEIPPICGCPALLVYKAKQLCILGFAEDDFFYVSQWEIQYLGNLWQILIFSGVP